VGNVSRLLSLDTDGKAYIDEQLRKKSRSRKLAEWLDKDSKGSLLDWWNPYSRKYKIPRNALYFVSEYQRSYPFGYLLGQVLHTVQGKRDELTGDAYPTGGLELQFDAYLKGKKGKRRLMRSPRNALETGDLISSPVDGADIHLTINHVLQAIAEEELERGVKKAKAKCGWAVMMVPDTGEILALAQYPFFHPSDYQRYFNTPALIDDAKVKANTDANEVGSTMKPISAAIALMANQELEARGEKPLFSPSEKIETGNGRFPGRSKPISDTHYHKYLNMEMAIMKSSNIYMARLVERIIQRLGAEWYRDKLHQVFGFGKKTGIELPSESAGLLPRIGKKHPNGALEWSTATPFSIAFGHNIQATSMQLIRAYCIMVNGGRPIDPTLIQSIERDGEILYQREQVEHPPLIRKEVLDQVVRGMKYTTKPGGSARRGDISGFSEGGKTGTTEKVVNGTYSKKINISTFVGFAPAKDPAFVLLVTVDEPEWMYIPGVGKNQMGGHCCAPVFREIARRSLEYLSVDPDDPHGYPVGDPRYNQDKADWVKESKALVELYQKWNAP
jgi:cell division protein FtsI (penicillin-binding protein 3)